MLFTDVSVHLCCILTIMVACIHSTSSLKNKDKPCSEIKICKCIFPTGRGIDLSFVDKDLRVHDQNNNTIVINLCENVQIGNNNTDNQCFSNVSVCLINSNSNQSTSLGKVEDMKFISKSERQLLLEPMSLQFDNNKTKTSIDLICNKEAIKPKLTFKAFDGLAYYKLQLESEHACLKVISKDGLSSGSLLVILFLMFTLVYFGGGMLTLRYLRGAEGREMIPNIDFWMDLPYLVRDGVLFTLNGFRPPTTYERI